MYFMSVTACSPQGTSHSDSRASCHLDLANREPGSLAQWPRQCHEDWTAHAWKCEEVSDEMFATRPGTQ